MANQRRLICSLLLAIILANFHPTEKGSSPPLLNVRKPHILKGFMTQQTILNITHQQMHQFYIIY
jgi:hypothetical protein